MGSFTLKDDAERKRRIDKVFSELFPVLANPAQANGQTAFGR